MGEPSLPVDRFKPLGGSAGLCQETRVGSPNSKRWSLMHRARCTIARSRRTQTASGVLAVGVAGAAIFGATAALASAGTRTVHADARAISRLLRGIPQHGQTLGSPRAEVTIDEYIDYACPACGTASRHLAGELINRYVRTGRVQMQLRPVAFVAGPSSEVGALGGFAAAACGRMWNYTFLVLGHQGSEGANWLTVPVAKRFAGIAGCTNARWTGAFRGPKVVSEEIATANQAFQRPNL